MKVRTQLVLACFLLSIVPLSGIVLYSYQSSRTALEAAYHREAARLARQMDRRLSSIRNELEQRLAEVSSLPLPNLPKGEMAPDAVVDDVLLALGESANLVDSIEVRPVPAAVAEKANAETHEAPEAPVAEAAEVPEAPDPPDPPDPVIIDIPDAPRAPRYRMSDAQRQQIREITRMGSELGAKIGQMTPEQRSAMASQISERQHQFQTDLQKSQDEYQQQLKEATRSREERRKELEEQRRARLAATHSEPVVVVEPAPIASPKVATNVVKIRRQLTADEKAQLKDHEKRIALLFGQKFNVPVRKAGAVVAQLSAQVKPEASSAASSAPPATTARSPSPPIAKDISTRARPTIAPSSIASASPARLHTISRCRKSRTGSSARRKIRRADCASAWRGRLARTSTICAAPPDGTSAPALR